MHANRRWVLARRPDGLVATEDFRLEETRVQEPAPGQFLVRVVYLSLAPVMAQYVLDGGVIEKPVPVGGTMRGRGVGYVVRSRHPDWKEGDVVHGPFGWQDYALSDGGGLVFRSEQRVAPISASVGVLGITGYTAYFGLTEIARVAPGDRVLVSGAVGGVGSVAGPIARLLGARPVVGICGSPGKCELAVGRLRYDAAIDYRAEDVGDRLDALLPEGIDVYFDNVGGRILELAIDRLRNEARVAVCGAISQYMVDGRPAGPGNYFKIVYRCARLHGFHVYAFAARFAEAERRMAAWVADGSLPWQEDRLHGLEVMPAALRRLFEGGNRGKQVVQIAEDPFAIPSDAARQEQR
ncbi:NADP-dependent oxidoreductase [Silanimonas sp.]|jgi:NADPH-dependent curcumin reductase CurA|uniref:NADP-dependent oxidoreductase n=1 Tax=Silanimonas sp. TaxID=1929290 RepID=UPI0022C7A093|nr:NADP-dependent oxidoreductase [Silanimonas sp.]MCZ8116192.1 NADP-dependent oxidoreductase [Silanimonas sp.]